MQTLPAALRQQRRGRADVEPGGEACVDGDDHDDERADERPDQARHDAGGPRQEVAEAARDTRPDVPAGDRLGRPRRQRLEPRVAPDQVLQAREPLGQRLAQPVQPLHELRAERDGAEQRQDEDDRARDARPGIGVERRVAGGGLAEPAQRHREQHPREGQQPDVDEVPGGERRDRERGDDARGERDAVRETGVRGWHGGTLRRWRRIDRRERQGTTGRPRRAPPRPHVPSPPRTVARATGSPALSQTPAPSRSARSSPIEATSNSGARARRRVPGRAGRVEPHRPRPDRVRAADVGVRAVADVQQFVRLDAEARQRLLEHRGLRLGGSLERRVQHELEAVRDADDPEVRVAVGDRRHAVARREVRQQRVDAVVERHRAPGAVEHLEGALGQCVLVLGAAEQLGEAALPELGDVPRQRGLAGEHRLAVAGHLVGVVHLEHARRLAGQPLRAARLRRARSPVRSPRTCRRDRTRRRARPRSRGLTTRPLTSGPPAAMRRTRARAHRPAPPPAAAARACAWARARRSRASARRRRCATARSRS